ncbi:hypothetical protein O6H91_02G091400 [Diphasiastrum complanatum]|uniref:Uncharacterized protein n=1 Tax=Diphasiastrum complanatum TaxID=34168 RepID=A0ACC2EI74_DIPCM|nr:hypothetical protein O6H91_02G091400 [Diphasiastrum complanatum]
MNRIQGRSEVVSQVVESVNFSFYTDEEVRAISVKKITNPILLDNLGNPVAGGLYDSALGPLDLQGSCITCGEASLLCPGHYGHIELALPIYNPLVFKMLVKILKSSCPYCHCLKMKKDKLDSKSEKLEFIAKGDLIEATNVMEQYISATSEIQAQPKKANSQRLLQKWKRQPWTSAQCIAFREAVREILAEMPTRKCDNCGAHVPGIKSEGVGKIFQAPLAKHLKAANIGKGLRLISPIVTGSGSSGEAKDGMNESEEILETKYGLSDEALESKESEVSSIEEHDHEGKRGKPEESSTIRGLELTDAELSTQPRFLTASEVKERLRCLWSKEERLCSLIWGAVGGQNQVSFKGQGSGWSMFFLQAVAVTPNRFRPPNRINEMLVEHPQNVYYGRLIQANIQLSEFLKDIDLHPASKSSAIFNLEKATLLWLSLQNAANALIDSTTVTGSKADQGSGVRQLLEKKEGLFRMNMMGKRVNYACRSVISPDPYISVNEIGIPPYFATRLTYPERVTPWNIQKLRNAVENGHSVHPGATHVEDEQGTVINLSNLKKHQRLAVAKTLLSTPGAASANSAGVTSTGDLEGSRAVGKIVYRHLRDGDIVLVNRQPTLHKPGVMAHRARVLKGEKTLRLHYANCSTYNADFDGDEMNVHFPQDEVGRAEAYQIVNANQQYVVPTSGEPIRGLIQDHIVGASLLTKRDTFLTKEEYQQLVYTACVSMASGRFTKKSLVGVAEYDIPISPVAPAIYKPRALWTGKQVVTTVLNFITQGRPPYSFKRVGRVSGDYWGKNSQELKVVVKHNELLCGVIDKAQFGKFGLVHSFHELYGPEDAGQLLSVFSRLFTSFLQMHGFTCGVADLLLKPDMEQERKEKLLRTEEVGDSVHARYVGIDLDNETEIGIESVKQEVEKALQTRGEPASSRLDVLMSSALNRITSNVNNMLFPKGLLKPFPKNCLSLMTVTGAKGGLVNFTQISSLLGQQELEGKRVPRMISGKTLPCFPPWDTGARSGGFISDRFLTGLRPQEYYFHCMAGRDGLVDTAVKTSRSGYLQRCLMKNLEGLKVDYDYTVRDSDGSMIQFLYGEDGVDVSKTSCLSEFKLLAANKKLVSQRIGAAQRKDKRRKKTTSSSEYEHNSDSVYGSFGGAYIKDMPEAMKKKLRAFIETKSCRKRELLRLRKQRHIEEFNDLMAMKYLSSLAQPGEPVGVLAAQSVGEPSTQMTLNTFHFAGRGEMNVTLGIPRLREILMTASRDISTPIMTCPLKIGKTREDAEFLASKLRRLRLSDLLEKIEVGVVPLSVLNQKATKVYKVRLKLYPPDRYPEHINLQFSECERAVREVFMPSLIKEMSHALSGKSGKHAVSVLSVSQLGEDSGESLKRTTTEDNTEDTKALSKNRRMEDGEQIEDVDDDVVDEEGADAEKRRGQETDEMGYDEEDEEEKAIAEQTRITDDSNLEEMGEEEDENDGFVYDDETTNRNSDSQKIRTRKSPENQKAEKIITKSAKRKMKQEAVEGVALVVSEQSVFEIQFSVDRHSPQILLPAMLGILQIVEKVVRRVTVRSVPGIERCSVIDYKGNSNRPALQTDGASFQGFWEIGEELDLKELTTNSVAAMLQVYGVEAARATILSEVQTVFGSYGIAVNSRHLGLIADFMTFQGGYRPCNRVGINASPSPFLKMSFETATSFLTDASLQGQTDHLRSPSARIVLGQPVQVGTGTFDLLQCVDAIATH